MQWRRGYGLALFATAAIAGASCNLAIGLNGYDFGSTGTGAAGASSSSGGSGGTGLSGGSGGTTGSGGSGASTNVPPGAAWAVSFGHAADSNDHTVNAMALDASDHIFLTGRSNGLVNADFGCDDSVQSGAGTGYVVEIDPSLSKCVWLLFFGQDAEGTAVSVDENNKVYVGGTFRGELGLPAPIPVLTATAQDSFVLQLDANRKAVWAHQITDDGGMNDQAVSGIASNKDTVAVAGTFLGPTKLAGAASPLFSGGEGQDSFILRFKPDGDLLDQIWIRSKDDMSSQAAQSLAMGNDGAFIAAGYTSGNTWFDRTTISKEAGIFYGTWGADAQLQNSGVIPATPSTIRSAAALDLTGTFLVAGEFQKTVQYNGMDLTNQIDPDIFLFQFVANPAAPLQLGSDDPGEGPHLRGLATFPTDSTTKGKPSSTALAGNFHGKLRFAGYPEIATTSDAVSVTNGFVAKIGPDFKPRWLKRIGDSNVLAGVDAVAIDLEGHTVIAGHFNEALDFGNEKVVTAAGKMDIFVATLTD